MPVGSDSSRLGRQRRLHYPMKNLKFYSSDDDRSAAFYPELKSAIAQQLHLLGSNGGTNFEFWVKFAVWTTLTWAAYILLLLHGKSDFTALGLGLVFGVSGLLLGFNIGHDASHRVVSKIPLIDDLLHHFSFITVGIDPTLWRLRHVRSHHIYSNVLGSDQDIDKNPFLRLSPEHPWSPRYRLQHLYAPLVYALALVHSVLWGDWVYLFSKEYDWMRQGERQIILVAKVLVNKLLHLIIVVGLPYYFLDLSLANFAIGYGIISGVMSLLFIILLVGTHFFDEAAFPKPDSSGRLKTNWALHQLETSCDWNPESRLAAFFSGGANAHAMHHLFPTVCHIHYRRLTPILRELTKKWGLRYHELSLGEMMLSHFRFLRRMAESPPRTS